MDTRQLQAFCEVVERKSFSLAAERLGVTQPAVSLQVRALEKRLGTQLLDRSGRRVEPTESGAKLYRQAQRLLALEEEILSDLDESRRALLVDLVLERAEQAVLTCTEATAAGPKILEQAKIFQVQAGQIN